jgi:hypothetical protein
MGSWQEERDRLIAQTQEFVNHVAATLPRVATAFEPSRTAGAVGGMAESPPPAGGPPDRPRPANLANAAIVVRPPTPFTDVAFDRAEIQERIEAFRTRQSQFAHDRKIYYEEMQARIRKTLGNDSDAD